MAKPLPCLRLDLDFMPSPVRERPGVLIRDPFRYTEATIIVPPLLAEGLSFFDGRQTDLDLQAHLVRRSGDLISSVVVAQMIEALAKQGFLHTEEFEQMKEAKQRNFREAGERKPVHAGAAYPSEEAALRRQLEEYCDHGAPAAAKATGRLTGVAAPHVSPDGGWRSYAAAYRNLGGAASGKTVVILGTSHYGAPEKFGLTKKPFVTPLGRLDVDLPLVDELLAKGSEAALLEDYCHSIEHSIEFQCIFLQHRLGSGIKILPILCGPFADSLAYGQAPERNDGLRRFLEALGEIGAREASRLFWVLGIDLAHIGRRYGDSFEARAEEGPLERVRREDELRLERVCAGDRMGFFELVKPNHDELRWCGYSPVYTFLSAMPNARGSVLRYEQWNIDERSVVSFAGLEFRT